MKQAGEGADYLEGCEGSRSQRCFKCGAIGHWAAECRGLEVHIIAINAHSQQNQATQHDAQCVSTFNMQSAWPIAINRDMSQEQRQ